MASTHAWLGLGEFPRFPVVDYLARSIAALYGFHGVLLLIVSTDPMRYRRIVSFIAVMNTLFGLMLIAIDVHAGLPLFWILGEGPPIAAVGLLMALLNSNAPAGWGPVPPPPPATLRSSATRTPELD